VSRGFDTNVATSWRAESCIPARAIDVSGFCELGGRLTGFPRAAVLARQPHASRKEVPMAGSHRVVATLALGGALVASAVHAEEVAGAAAFKQYCAPCHSLTPGVNRYAPSLAGVIGRKAGTVQGFEYSKALQLQKSGLVWNGKTLDEWLRDPHAAVPETGMAFDGLKNAEQRRAVIEFLEREDAAR
jgi:cytochrome c